MKKSIIAALICLSTAAYAQTAEDPEAAHEGKAVPGDSAQATGPGSEHNENIDAEGDPTQHWNFANHWFDYKKYDEYGGVFGDGKMEEKDANGNVVRVVNEEEPMSAPFLFMLLNFGLLLLILGKYGAPVARKMAEERHDQIKTALDEAAKLREQAAQKLAEYETRIKDVDAEVKKLVDGIRADAEADKKRIMEASAAQAAAMKRDAELRIAAEIEIARASLTKEVTAAAANATEKLLREKVTSDDQNKLVTTFLSNVASSAGKEAR